MTIKTNLTPTQCKLIRICLEFAEGVLIRSDAEIDVFNADGSKLLRYTMNIPWIAAEQAAIENSVMAKYETFKTTNGFIELEKET